MSGNALIKPCKMAAPSAGGPSTEVQVIAFPRTQALRLLVHQETLLSRSADQQDQMARHMQHAAGRVSIQAAATLAAAMCNHSYGRKDSMCFGSNLEDKQ